MRHRFGETLLCWLVFAAPFGSFLAIGNDARAADSGTTAEVTLDGHTLRVSETGALVDLGCQGRASLRVGNKVFVACGPDGVVEIDVSDPGAPRRTGHMSVGGEATGLFERDGRAWVEIAHVEARPVSTEATPVATSAPPDRMQPTPNEPAPSAAPSKPSLVAPPRRSGLWELSAWAGAFVNLGPLGAGAQGWASAVYRFDAPVVVRVEIAPAAFTVGHSATNLYGNSLGVSSTDNADRFKAVGAAHALVGVDTQFVEVALGGGFSTISTFAVYSSPSNMYVANGTTNSGPSIVEEGRFGARDGLAVNVESSTVAANDKFQLGFFSGSVQVPLTRSAMLIIRGGGGNMGLLFGDLGARVVVEGDGGRGTMALSGYFGGAGINFQSCAPTNTVQPGTACESFSLGGPSIGGGIEYRR